MLARSLNEIMDSGDNKTQCDIHVYTVYIDFQAFIDITEHTSLQGSFAYQVGLESDGQYVVFLVIV